MRRRDASKGPGSDRIRVLVLADFYLPGYRGGGPQRSVGNLVSGLEDDVSFMVVTRDHDLGTSTPYEGVVPGRWQRLGMADVWYQPRRGQLRAIWRILRTTGHDILYLNSAFSRAYTLWPLVLRRLRLVPVTGAVVLAPRGEFSAGARSLKPRRKGAFLRCARWTRFYRDVTWQASSTHEAADIQRVVGAGAVSRGTQIAVAHIVVAADVTEPTGEWRPARDKEAGTARLVHLARVVPMKNLGFALELLHQVEGDVSLDIFGPHEDEEYWRRCQEAIASLPDNVSVSVHGEIDHSEVREVLHRFHLLVLPTRGENFGHVIHEALSSGCPVLISDRTPWRGLAEAGAGWDLDLDDEAAWAAAIHAIVSMDQERFDDMSKAASRFASSASARATALDEHRELFVIADRSGA